jgi:hypothetical protein
MLLLIGAEQMVKIRLTRISKTRDDSDFLAAVPCLLLVLCYRTSAAACKNSSANSVAKSYSLLFEMSGDFLACPYKQQNGNLDRHG